MEPKTKTEK